MALGKALELARALGTIPSGSSSLMAEGSMTREEEEVVPS